MIYEPMPHNYCSKCKQIKPWTREYWKWTVSKGIHKPCIDCSKEYLREWYKRNGDKQRAKSRQYRIEHVDEYKKYLKEWYKRNRTSQLEHHKQYRKENRQYFREYERKRRPTIRERDRANSEHVNERKRAWRQKNAIQDRATQLKRRARKRGLVDAFSAGDWRRCLNYWSHRCAYCGNPQGLFDYMKLTAEHFIPLTSQRCPGTTPGNIIPACKSCNTSKQNKEAADWLAEKFGQRKAKQILARIAEYFEWVKNRREHN